MNDYEQRIKVLEEKVKILEETLSTLKNMQMSEQMQGYIKAKTRTLKMAELINSISDKPELDLSKEENAVKEIQEEKRTIDEQISNSFQNNDNYSEECATDEKYFEYEIIKGIGDIGKAIRITAYNGFDCESVIIPSTIAGLPVTVIGRNVFKNTTISKIIFPKSISEICESAFWGCKNLKNIELPHQLHYLGDWCFCESGLTHVSIPDYVDAIRAHCFHGCKSLSTVTIGKYLNRIDENVFDDTNIKTCIVPENVKSISETAFGGNAVNAKRVVDCVFLGKDTTVAVPNVSIGGFRQVRTIYCLPGSNAQKYAREHNIPVKPLSEFKLEE